MKKLPRQKKRGMINYMVCTRAIKESKDCYKANQSPNNNKIQKTNYKSPMTPTGMINYPVCIRAIKESKNCYKANQSPNNNKIKKTNYESPMTPTTLLIRNISHPNLLVQNNIEKRGTHMPQRQITTPNIQPGCFHNAITHRQTSPEMNISQLFQLAFPQPNPNPCNPLPRTPYFRLCPHVNWPPQNILNYCKSPQPFYEPH